MFEILHQKTTATADFIESVRFIVPRFELKLTFFGKLFIDTSHVCIFFFITFKSITLVFDCVFSNLIVTPLFACVTAVVTLVE